MSARERCPELERLEVILRTLRPVLSRRAPRPLAEIEDHLKRLRQQRWRIAVAGAQGNGKSSLVRALLASPSNPDPPVPVSDREETRIPVLYRKGAKPTLREVGKLGKKIHKGPIDEDAIRRRASVDRTLLDRARYATLDALEVELPGVALEGEIDLVDLPGVAGNLASVSGWAIKNLLERGSQGVIFVLAPSSTIEATAEEANLIRAFGPLMVRTIFVHNVWSGYDDDNDATERLNLEFLRRHIGGEVRYVRVDVRAALEAARRGASDAIQPVLDGLAPFFRGDLQDLTLDEAGRLKNLLDEVLRALAVDLLAASGRADAARAAARAIEAERAKVRAALDQLTRDIRQEVEATRGLVHGKLEGELDGFERQLDDFVRDRNDLQQDVFEREVARRVGSLQRAIKNALSSEFAVLLERVKAQSREALGRLDLEGLAEPDVQIDAPQLALGLERQMLGAVKWIVNAAAGIGGALVGAIGGPLGAIVGGLLGGLVGWLAGIVLDRTVGATLSERERSHIRSQLRASLEQSRKGLIEAVDGAVDGVAAQLTDAVKTFQRDRDAVFVDQVRQSAAGGEVLVKLGLERRILEQARQGIDALLTSAVETGA